MRNLLLAIVLPVLVSSSALLTGCTDDLATDDSVIVAAPLDDTGAADRPELAAPSGDTAGDDRAPARALADGASTNAIPCPTPAQRMSPTGERPREEEVVADEGGDVCAALPEEGPCSLACDPDALVDTFVPKGTCVTYRCELKSGQVFQTGGCNP